jgi:glycosidase
VPNYETFANNVATMPKLMTANPAVHDYLLGVIRKWTSELQLDGWRLDVCNEVDHAFWRDFRQTVRSINNQTFILGEIWHDAMPWLQGDQLDSVMNYLFRGVTLDFFAEGKFGPEKFGAQVNALLRRYQRYVTRGLLNLLGSHDTPRLMTVCGGDKRKARMATVFQFLYPGLPMIYCGDEIGMEGGPDPDCRRPMIWDERRQDREMLAMYRRLVELRHQAPWLSDVGFESLWSDDSIGVFAMRRFNPQGTGEILAVFNTSAEDRKVGVNCSSGTWVNAFTSGNYTVSGGHVDIAVEALGVTVLMRSDR